MPKRYLMSLDQIKPGTCRSLTLNHDEAFLLQTHDGHVHCYLNRCPHKHSPLNWSADEFLTLEKDYIVCATHGALFQMESGICIAGPGVKQSLTRIDVSVEEGAIYLTDGEKN